MRRASTSSSSAGDLRDDGRKQRFPRDDSGIGLAERRLICLTAIDAMRRSGTQPQPQPRGRKNRRRRRRGLKSSPLPRRASRAKRAVVVGTHGENRGSSWRMQSRKPPPRERRSLRGWKSRELPGRIESAADERYG
uniref:Uncharacterized protein n=1 Tax=Odontella aurita TaxID=265563 RepID=A0A7S4IJ72_9STRA|mmetsp:Transcript_25799/g.76200  ORF Transcript_25799/g.76200 Transcript_25799/m.76200 type:complete len:136 (+) Transcript_25799:294-701(+)